MQKKTMLTALIALGFITPIISNTGASAAEFNQNEPNASAIIQKLNQQQQKLPKLSEKQLKIQDSDIETWMPNPTVRESVLRFLIAHRYLSKGSTVNDITRDLLGSVDDATKLNIEINTFEGDQITSDLSEGLQYFNPKARISLGVSIADEAQAMQIDFAQLNKNVYTWNITIINPDKIANPKLAQKIFDAKLPKKTGVPNEPKIFYLQANYTHTGTHLAPIFTKSIDISQTLFPTLNLKSNDFWTDGDYSKFTSNPTTAALVAKSNNVTLLKQGRFYEFQNVSEGNFVGTLPKNEATISAMERVNEAPQNYYIALYNNHLYEDKQYQSFGIVSVVYADYHK
ncbi:hypothetical protein ACSR7A_00475 [Pediococcus acidilactici]